MFTCWLSFILFLPWWIVDLACVSDVVWFKRTCLRQLSHSLRTNQKVVWSESLQVQTGAWCSQSQPYIGYTYSIYVCACLTSRDVWHLVLLYICTCVTLHVYNSGLCAEWSMCVSKTETATPHPQVPSPTSSQHCSRKIKRKRHGLGKTYLFALRRLSLLLSGECQLNSAIYISIAFWGKWTIRFRFFIQHV